MWEEPGEQKGCHLLLDLNKVHFRPKTLWLKSSRRRWGLLMELQQKHIFFVKKHIVCIKLLIPKKTACA